MKEVYDVAIIGAGPCGIVSAIELGRKNKSVVLIERGKHYAERICSVDQHKRCVNCSPCNVISGYGGCVHYGDSAKLSAYPSGKELYNSLGKKEYEKMLDKACQYWGIDKDISFQLPILKGNTSFEIKNYPVCVINSDKIKNIVEKSYDFFKRQSNVEIELDTSVTDIKKEGDVFEIVLKEKRSVVKAKQVILAVGRGGLFWLKDKLDEWGVLNKEPESSIGVRFEMPKEYLEKIGKKHPDLKIRALVGEKKLKTFCFCAGMNGGRIKEMNYGNVSLLDGHILTETDISNGMANFALLMKLKKPVASAKSYDNYIREYLEQYRNMNLSAKGKPVCQTYIDFKNKIEQKSKLYDGKSSIAELSYGDVYKLFSQNELKDFCAIAEEIFKYIWNDTKKTKSFEDFLGEILVIGLEMEGLWSRVEVNAQFESTVKGLYFGGDCAGRTQGILQATISGLEIAKSILSM